MLFGGNGCPRPRGCDEPLERLSAEYAGHPSEKDEQGRAQVAGHHRAHGLGGKALVRQDDAGIQSTEAVGDDAELGVGLLDADSGLEARAKEEEMALVGGVEVGLLGEEEVGFWLAGEAGAHDTNGGEGLGVEPDGAADDARVTAKAPLPEAVREDHDARPARAVSLGRVGAANHRGDAE